MVDDKILIILVNDKISILVKYYSLSNMLSNKHILLTLHQCIHAGLIKWYKIGSSGFGRRLTLVIASNTECVLNYVGDTSL